MLIVGADSHTVMLGAIGAFATGVGSTEMAAVLATGGLWFRVPETYKLIIEGSLPEAVTAKDVVLHIIGDIGEDGARYKAVEYTGSTVKEMSIDSRIVLSNMTVEMGGKAGIIEADEKTIKYVTSKTYRTFELIKSDVDAKYADLRTYNVSKLEPQVACPPHVDDVRSIEEVEGIEINQAYIGSCTGGRLEDLRLAARILKGRKINSNVRLIVAPQTWEIYLKALEEGTIMTLVQAGAMIIPCGCGPCVGAHSGLLAPGEVAVSTGSRNFPGRMGSKEAFIYLVSPATAAASAIEGKIADPRKYV